MTASAQAKADLLQDFMYLRRAAAWNLEAAKVYGAAWTRGRAGDGGFLQ